MRETKIGKISHVRYGLGGYQDAMLGISFTLSSEGWGVGDFWGAWSSMIEHTEYCKWTEESRIKSHGDTAMRISKLLLEAKVTSVDKLKGVPVEVTFEGNQLKSWRVLTEAL